MGLGADMGVEEEEDEEGVGGRWEDGGMGWAEGCGGVDKGEEKLLFTAMKKAADEETGTAARVNPK